MCLWGLLTTNGCLQVCGGDKGQRPVEEKFPYKYLGSSCCSILLQLHQRQYLAPEQKLTGTPMLWILKLSHKKSSPHMALAPSLTVIAAFPVVIL